VDAGPSIGARTEPAPSPVGALATGLAEHAPAAERLAAQPEDNGDSPPVGHTEPAPAPVKVLVLNATMEPLCVIPARRAVVLVITDKADVVHHNGHRFRSERIDMPAPSVVRLRRYVRVPYRRQAALSRRGVFIRDGHTCQYCGRGAENVDHVVPRSRGGEHSWENVVAACRRCNGRKRDQTPAEANMSLMRSPYAPRAAFWLVVAVGRVSPDWETYLGDVIAG
jgi:5-methylcytosine-specific restriction endonuclease McrA